MQPLICFSVHLFDLLFLFGGVRAKRDSWGRARVCLSARTVPSCDLVPSWQQSPLNRGPLSHKGSAGYTQTAHTLCQTAGHQLHTWHTAIMSPVCVCVSERLCKSCRHHLLRPLWTCPPHSVSLHEPCTCVFFMLSLFSRQPVLFSEKNRVSYTLLSQPKIIHSFFPSLTHCTLYGQIYKNSLCLTWLYLHIY